MHGQANCWDAGQLFEPEATSVNEIRVFAIPYSCCPLEWRFQCETDRMSSSRGKNRFCSRLAHVSNGQVTIGRKSRRQQGDCRISASGGRVSFVGHSRNDMDGHLLPILVVVPASTILGASKTQPIAFIKTVAVDTLASCDCSQRKS